MAENTEYPSKNLSIKLSQVLFVLINLVENWKELNVNKEDSVC
jgi:hypothetical protein